MKLSLRLAIPALAASLFLGACSSGSTSDPTPAPTKPTEPLKSPTVTSTGASPAKTPSGISLGDDAKTLREAANDAIANKDTDGARVSAEKALDKHVPDGSDGEPDKRTELIDKATEAARKKAKELGKEEDLDKVRSAIDGFLNKKES